MKKIFCVAAAIAAAVIMSVAAYADDGYFFAESAMYSEGKLYTNIEDCGDTSLPDAYTFYVADSYILYVTRNVENRTSVLHCCNKDMTNDRIIVEDIWGSDKLYYCDNIVYYTYMSNSKENIYKVDVKTGQSTMLVSYPYSEGGVSLSGIENGYLYYSVGNFSNNSKIYKININNPQDIRLMYLSSKIYAYSVNVENNKLYINTSDSIKVIDTETGKLINSLTDNGSLIAGVYNDTVYLSDDFSVWRIGSDNVLGYMSTNDKLKVNTAVELSIMQDNIIYFTLNPADFYGYIPGNGKRAVCTFDVLTNKWEIFE